MATPTTVIMVNGSALARCTEKNAVRMAIKMVIGGGPRCLDSLMGGISSDSVDFFLVKHQAASANG